MTPYRNQADALQKLYKGTIVQADTVDKFQGRECDTIIISTVDNEITSFSDDPNRLNVAISRAKNQLIVVTDSSAEERESNIKDLISYIRYNNLDVINSQVYSVFDYLYKAFEAQRRELLKGKKKVSQMDSENLMYGVICEVLVMEQYSKYDVNVHVPINMILKTLTSLHGMKRNMRQIHLPIQTS